MNDDRIARFVGEFEFLSNFYPHHGTMSVEHWFQAAKTDDPAWAARILMAPSPGEAKKLGRRAPLRDDWDSQKISVMRSLLLTKFTTTDLFEKLLQTGHAELIEGNHWGDTFWGVCDGGGQNWLGKLLMEVRRVLQEAVVLGASETDDR